MSYLITRILLGFFALFPLPTVHFLGGLVGRALFWFPNQIRQVTRINVAHCFAEYTPAQQTQFVRNSLIETAKAIAETGPLWLWPSATCLQLVTRISGLKQLQTALRAGQGAIIAAPHMGAWELIGLYCSTLHPMTILYRPPKVARLDSLMRHSRERLGTKLVATEIKGIRALYDALGSGELIGILPDQDPGFGQGRFAPFFGIPANTMVLLSRLAIKTKAPVFFAYAERLPHGQGYHLHFVQQEIAQTDLATSVQLVNQAVEACVRSAPEQYQWGYKRFKTRPEGEQGFY